MGDFRLEYFEKEDGVFPVEEFILSQQIKLQASIFRVLELLEMEGNQLREPFSKHLCDGIFELRIKRERQLARILYFFISLSLRKK